MKDFVLFGKRMGFDRVYFSFMWNLGTYSEDEFKEVSMFDTEGKMKPQLKAVIEDPIFREPIVDLIYEPRE